MNILHLVSDEKFILFFDGVFSKLPGVKNRYLVQGDKNKPLKHIDGLDVYRRVGKGYFFSSLMRKDLAWADCLVVHILSFGGVCMLLNTPANVVTVWSGWGADYYRFLPGGKSRFWGEATASLMGGLGSDGNKYVASMRKFARTMKNVITTKLYKKAANKVDFFSAPIKCDFVLLKEALGEKFTAEYIQLNYGSVEQTFISGLQGDKPKVGSNILIGNSATPTNNHVEAFYLISGDELYDRKVIVPLSYGDAKYREAVIEKGKDILGDSLEPVVKYMPLNEYNKLISQCSIVIMNHYRQQALGNIGTMLYQGAKVFLDEKSPVYSFFKQNGAHVYSTNLLHEKNNDLFKPLSATQIAENRSVLESFWGRGIVMNNAKIFVEKVRL